jgi:hypothetical protein
MAEFLHQVVKKREREMEMRGLVDWDNFWSSPSRGHVFRVPTIPLPPVEQIGYRAHTSSAVTEHSIIFPNVNGWLQSMVCIMTPATVTVQSLRLLTINAWEMLAGHPCRPNYRWSNNTYSCRSCGGRYTTDGSEWQHG